jgi:protein-L-isoaspartate(D-aspartate) O-methyltransferase
LDGNGSPRAIVAQAARLRRGAAFAAFVAVAALSLACVPGREGGDGWSDATRVTSDAGFRERRLALVRSLEAEGIRDSATLAAMRAVPRHEFVPASYRHAAYLDEALPIAHEQTISQPYVVAFMTEACRPRPGMKVLEVGTGSGYQAAVLAEIGCRVHTIEIVRALADSARDLLRRLGYANVEVRHGDGYLGWPEAAPFDAIVVTAAPETMPAPLVEQLAPGGRLIAPVGGQQFGQELTLVEKDAAGNTQSTRLLPVRFVPMRKDVR